MSISFVYPHYLWLLLLVPLTAALAVLSRRGLTPFRKWGGLGLRVFLLTLIVLALAGIQLRLPAESLSVVFVLDVSDSIPPEDQARGEALIGQAVEAMPAGDRAAIVVFGEDALVERLATEERRLEEITSVPVTTRTDIASALQLAMALFPNEGAKRLVLLSDGRENLSQALEQAGLAAIQNVELQYVPLGVTSGEIEVLVDALVAPASVRQGQDFDLEVVIQSTRATLATLRLFGDDQLIETRELRLQEGANRYRLPIQATETGFRRFRAQIVPDQDNRLQNNEASAFTLVEGPPAVLIVEGTPGESENLRQALEAAEMDVDVRTPAQLPATLPELARYDAAVLVNVPAAALPSGAMEALPVYVRELGRGLLMTGGETAFGAGGYLRTPLETALPVSMDVKSRELSANLALVLAVDKSGSMGRCHCDNPDLNQTYTRAEVGQPKVDIAKEAIMRAAGALGPQDYLGVVAFDSQARWVLRVNPLVDPYSLEQSISSFQAEGQTNLATGVTAAYEGLKNVDARRKHIILMTDGWVHEGDLTELAKEMNEQGITLSVVAAGEGSAEYLEALSVNGGGRYYPATDMLNVPDIFLKETVKSVGEYIIEEPFYPLPASPSPILRGLDWKVMPALLGYNGTSAKGTARLDLLTPRGDPLLASWQYGLGRAAVWTSDLKGQWGKDWVAWGDFARFSAQLVGWLLPTPQVEGLSANISLIDEGALIQLNAQDQEGRPLNFLSARAHLVDPGLNTLELPLEQVGPGEYQVLADVSQPGTYLVRLGVNQQDQSLGQMTMGLVVPYSPEYRVGGTNFSLLNELARLTGGSPLADPLQAFLHNLPAADYAREIWHTLLLIAALLFPLDVALRRLILGPQDWRRARVWLGERLSLRRPEQGEQPRVLGNLFSARERTRERIRSRQAGREAPSATQSSEQAPAADQEKSSSAPPEEPGPTGTQPETSPDDRLARLREAKKRARDPRSKDNP